MEHFKVFGVCTILFLFALGSAAQTTPPSAPVIYDSSFNGNNFRALRFGSYSNRTVDGKNTANAEGVSPAPVWNGSPKTWEYFSENSWNTKFLDGKTNATGSITAGSKTLTTTSATFASNDVNKFIEITGAGPSAYSPLYTTITGFTNSKSVTIATAASTTVSNAKINYGAKPAFTEGHYTTYGFGNFEMNYRLLFPVGYNQSSSTKYPLIVMVHGAGERGNCWGSTCFGNAGNNYSTNGAYRNNDLQLSHGGQPHLNAVYASPTATQYFPGFVVFPQNDSGWNGASNFEQCATIIDLLIRAYKIDPDRIFIHGLSDGAQGVWEIAAARPDLFACMVPMSATISHSDAVFLPHSASSPANTVAGYPAPATINISNVVPIPAWVVNGATDQTQDATVGETNQTVAELLAAGASIRYTILPNTGHDTWDWTYAQPDFFKWMLSHNKRNIFLLYGDSTLCATDNSGVTMALSQGFYAYQWQKDGVIIPGATSSTYTTMQPGSFKARFSRISATPTEAQWNAWSKAVTIRQNGAVAPTIVAVGTSHMPDVNNVTSTVRINGPTTSHLIKNWYVNGNLSTVNNNFPLQNNKDTASYTLRSTPGGNSGNAVVTLKTIPLNACASIFSNSIYVTFATPTGLTVPASPSGISPAAGTVQLFWTDNTQNETGFEIYRSTTSTGTYSFVALVPQGTVSYTDVGLAPNTNYFYKLRAVNNTDMSLPTAAIPVSTTLDNQPPTAPQNLVYGTRTINSIALSWTASTDNTGVKGYNIYDQGALVVSNVNATSYNVTGLSPNTNHLYTVIAVDLANNNSTPSNQLAANTTFTGLTLTYSAVNVVTLADPANNWFTPEQTGTSTNFSTDTIPNKPPNTQDTYYNLMFTGYIYFTHSGTYTFQLMSDDGSALYLGSAGSAMNPFLGDTATNRIINVDGLHADSTKTGTFTVTTDNTVVPITVIYFQATGGADLAVGYSGPDTNGSLIAIPDDVLTSGASPPLTAPLAPTTVSAASAGMNSINVTWTAALNTDYYQVYRSIDGTNFSVIASPSTSPFTDTGLLPNTTYYYELKSISNTKGSSGFSTPIASATTDHDTAAPDVPLNVVVLSNNYTNAIFQWDASNDNVLTTGYNIYANGILLGSSATTTYYTTSLLPSTSYAITVSAYDASANESLQSDPASFTTPNPSSFYSKTLATDLSLLSSWGTATDGSGDSPTSFAYDGQYFNIQGSQTLSTALTIGGSVSRVILSTGASLTITQPLTAMLRVGDNVTINFNVDYQPSFESISPSSTVVYNTYSSVPISSYGNLTLNDTGLKNLAAGTLSVSGNLTLGNGVGLQGAPFNGTTIQLGGNLNTGATVALPSADNRVALQFTGSSQSMTISSDQYFYKLATNSGTTVTFNGSSKSLFLGTENSGGGIDLANGSTLVMGNNTLSLSGNAVVNPTNATGQLSFNMGSIQLTTTASDPANFYFATGGNHIQDFTLQSTGGALTNIQSPVQIFDAVQINSGVLNAGGNPSGNITLKSSATATAEIKQIVSGSITGNVTVERYLDPKQVYRYLSSPAAAVKVSQWQQYIPITGSFSGASPGTSNASMFNYNDPQYNQYPVSSNTEVLKVGQGYAIYVRNGTTPTTLSSVGVPNQGDISFTTLLTTDGTGATTDGWNLLGNPYASPIVWGNTGWTSSQVNNVISVRNNFKTGGGYAWMVWDRSSSSGSLTGGKIPAGQAFWVRTTGASPTLTVTEAAKVTDNAASNSSIFRSAADPNVTVFSMVLDDGTNQDYTFIKLTDDGADTFDKISDGVKRLNSFFNLSTRSSDNISLAFNSASNNFCAKTVPLTLAPGDGLTSLKAGTYNLTFANLSNFSLANIQLVDAFLNTATPISNSSAPYSVVVTSNPATYTNRFSLQLTRPDIITSNSVASEKSNYCVSEKNVIVTINNSQPGVNYTAIGKNAVVLSDTLVGNGQTIQLTVSIKNLPIAKDTIQVVAYFSGCTPLFLTNTMTVTVSDLPSVTVPAITGTCFGSTVSITATGDGATYQWVNESVGQLLREPTNVLQAEANNTLTHYSVIAVSASGCSGATQEFLVLADSLNTPTVTLSSNGLLQTDGTQNVQWFFNGTPISGATENQYKPAQSGSYSVTTHSTYCSRASTPVEYLITGIESGTNEFTLMVYPNPSESGIITVAGKSSPENPLQLQVIDMLGAELISHSMTMQEFVNGFTLDTHLPGGIYIVRISQNNSHLYQKVVIR